MTATASRPLYFVKGHCGWDVSTLLVDGQVDPEHELQTAIKILNAPVDGGLEVGFLGAGSVPGEIRLRMVNSTTRDWIPMCGGMTQLIGKALVETALAERFAIDRSGPSLSVILVTDAGRVPLNISIDNGRVTRVETGMGDYARFAYQSGVEQFVIGGVPVMRVGKYAVIRIEDLGALHPGEDFTRRTPGRHLDIVHDILREFGRRLGFTGVNAMLFDAAPQSGGDYRVYPRFFSPDLAAARLPWEFQCGTGSIAVVIALSAARLFAEFNDKTIKLEWGNYSVTPDPYGVRVSEVKVRQDGTRIVDAGFSHSIVEILAEGFLTLPVY